MEAADPFAPSPPPPPPPPTLMVEETGEATAESDDEALLSRAQKLVSKIISDQANPNPRLLHALASMLELQESRYLQESGSLDSSNGRASHCIGKLGNILRENDEFYELMSSKFLSESRYSVCIHAATARLLLSCYSTWMYPHVLDDAALDNTKRWVMEDSIELLGDECDWKHELGINKPRDSEMLATYATGLLAITLAGGSQVVEDMLTSGLSAKLMRYLRKRVLGDVNVTPKDVSLPVDAKQASVATSVKVREENRGRSRQVTDAYRVDGQKTGDQGLLGEQADGEGCLRVGTEILRSDLINSSPEEVCVYDVMEDEDPIGDADENIRDDSSRHRTIRAWSRIRGEGRIKGVHLENERALTSPCSGPRLGGMGRVSMDRNLPKNEDTKVVSDVKENRIDLDGIFTEECNDDRFRDCNFGSRDISDMVKRATRAAEAEARAANAPPEAIKAAGDAAAELVKTAALEAWESTNDEEAVALAASTAASTVVDAAIATEVSRTSSDTGEKPNASGAPELEMDEEIGELIIPDEESLAQDREKYSVQCLEILGEYVEALGPVLHEKGVDVCLALLQRSFKDEKTLNDQALLPEVLKLICALAAHRKFAAVFVDRGGMQKLLSVQRVSHTFFGLSSCLFTIGSLQGIMERVCALPSDVVHRVTGLALQLLECPQDQARKNAALFFANAFVFRAVLDSFDAQDGLQKILNLLGGVAAIRSGNNSGILHIPNQSHAEVLTASEKQIAYHTCVALRQYYRSHLILLVDSLRPNKSNRSVARSTPSARAAYKPLDISNEAMDAIFLQIQRDRKLGPAFVRAPWPVVEKFLVLNGHLTLLELSQAPPVERYLHDLAQYALGVLHIVTFVPHSRKFIVNATLSNDRVGMAVILDAANGAGYADPEVIHSALNVLVNLVCPPPSISNKPSVSAQGQQSIVPNHTPNGRTSESRERHFERNISDRTVLLPSQNEPREHNLVERTALSTPFTGSGPQPAMPATPSGVVGDRRITLGTGPGCAGLATQLEQGYRQAREAVRANNGIKVLLHLLQPRMITPPATLDCIRALACRVLLGLARDDTIAHILTKLQVGKKLSELIRDSGSQASGTEQEKWQSQLAQVAIELIAIVTNSERASTLAATDATAPTLRRIERAAIASATPITYHSRELLLLIQEHLQLSGLTATATLLQKEADLTPLPLSGAPPPPLHRTSVQETSSVQMEWPSGRSTCGFLSNPSKTVLRDESSLTSTRVKLPVFSSKISDALKNQSSPFGGPEPQSLSIPRSQINAEPPPKTPISVPLKRKFVELKDQYSASPAKRQATTEMSFQSLVCQTPTSGHRNLLPLDGTRSDDFQYQMIPGATPTTAQPTSDLHPGNTERMTLDSLVVQYLKNQHRHCSAPITTLPPLSLLHPHVCPEPSHSLNAPGNVTARVSTREFRKEYGGIRSHRRDRQFVYSRFKPSRTCRDDGALLSCLTFLGSSSRIATGCHSGELKIFDTNNGNVLESHSWHQSPVTLVQSAFSGDTQMVLSSGTSDVRLWDASVVSGGPLHLFEGCKAARFSHSGTTFAAIGTEVSPREVLLYDIQTYNVLLRLPESSNGNSGQLRGHSHSVIHFSPLDTMLLWSGILWDRRSAGPVHRFDQFTDYGGGGFHPAGNEVIINSEVWDLRKFKLLRSVPSLDQTVMTFNAGGDIIYAILRRNLDDITSAVNTRRVRNPLFPAFRTIDAATYSDIATVPVDRCVLDFAADPTDSFVGVVTMDDNEDMFSSARLYEIGRRRPTDDDSDPDDGVDTEEDDDDDDDDDDNDSEADLDPILGADLDSALGSDSSNQDDGDDDSGDGDFNVDDLDFDGDQGLAEFMVEGEDDEDSEVESFSSEEDDEFDRFGF